MINRIESEIGSLWGLALETYSDFGACAEAILILADADELCDRLVSYEVAMQSQCRGNIFVIKYKNDKEKYRETISSCPYGWEGESSSMGVDFVVHDWPEASVDKMREFWAIGVERYFIAL